MLGVWRKVPENDDRSLEEGAGKRCSEFGGRCRKAMLGVYFPPSRLVFPVPAHHYLFAPLLLSSYSPHLFLPISFRVVCHTSLRPAASTSLCSPAFISYSFLFFLTFFFFSCFFSVFILFYFFIEFVCSKPQDPFTK